jgi:hypothetical protein
MYRNAEIRIPKNYRLAEKVLKSFKLKKIQDSECINRLPHPNPMVAKYGQ